MAERASAVLRPETPAELAGALATADGGILVCGHGSTSGRGADPGRIETVVSLERFHGVVRLRPEDLTARVRAGTNLDELQEVLAEVGLALAPGPFPSGARTIGGLLAEDPPNPRGFRRAALRSQLLGLAAADARGRLFKAGGAVVKNVAGYDLMKLFVGSGGAYFAAYELELRLIARPEAAAVLASDWSSPSDAARLWRRTRREVPQASFLDLVLDGTRARIELGLAGSAGYVRALARRVGWPALAEGREAFDHPPVELSAGALRGRLLPSRIEELVGGGDSRAGAGVTSDGRPAGQGPLRGRVHADGDFAFEEGGPPPPGLSPEPLDPRAAELALRLKRAFGGKLAPRRLSFTHSVPAAEDGA